MDTVIVLGKFEVRTAKVSEGTNRNLPSWYRLVTKRIDKNETKKTGS